MFEMGKEKNNCIVLPGVSILLNIKAMGMNHGLKLKWKRVFTNIYRFCYLFPEQTHWVTLPSVHVQAASGPICCTCDPKTICVPLEVQTGSEFKPSNWMSVTLRENWVLPRHDLKISLSESKVCLVRAKWWCG